jgi:hypothetical protein
MELHGSVRMMLMFCSTHRPDAQYRQPEIPLRIIGRYLSQKIALPAYVVGDVHEADHDVRDPNYEKDDPVRRTGSVISKSIRHRPGYHTD